MVPPSSNPYSLAAGACFALAGALFDLRTRRIPNRLTGAAVLVAFLVNAVTGGVRGLLGSLPALLLAGAAFAVMFFMGSMGGGDVKLMAAIAAFAGLRHLPELLLSTALAGGIFALALAVARAALRDSTRTLCGCVWIRHIPTNDFPQRAGLYLPYGVPIAVGALLTFSSGVLA